MWSQTMPKHLPYVRRFDTLRAEDVSLVGGKNASLGEMIHALKVKKIRVPDGYATTAGAYWEFLAANQLTGPIRTQLAALQHKKSSLAQVGKAIRALFPRVEFPAEIAEAIRAAYHDLSERYDTKEVDVAVRSSATAEDLPAASFAGQQESFLNVRGEDALLEACKKCYASLFTDRAISYRTEKGFDHLKVALSIGVQKMVRADKAGAGVMFSIDPETGFPHVVVINAAWGLGENVVQGTLNPDSVIAVKRRVAHAEAKL